MNRTTVLTTAVLSAALLAPTVPAAAATGAATTPMGAQVGAGHDHDRWDHNKRDRDGRDRDRHRHRHWRGFAIAGVIEDIDLDRREIRIDPRRGRDRVIEIRDFTRIRLDGDRARLADLDEGDRAFVRGVKKHGDRYAIRIWADER